MTDDERLDCAIALATLLLAGLLCLCSSSASAAPPDTRTTPTVTEPPPSLLRCQRAHVLPEGVVAPCSGLLVPEAEAREAALCVGVGLPTCRVELAECRDVGAVERKACLAVQAADQSEIAALRRALLNQRPTLKPASLVSRPWFIATVAGVLGVGLGVAIGWAVTR